MIRFAHAAVFAAALALAGCTGGLQDIAPKAERQLPAHILTSMKAKGMSQGSPIMVRIFKEEGELEIWKQKQNGRYDKIASYEICKWSGRLGPKFVEGDRQAPEGFYTVRPGQMNPQSSYHLAFNIGYPNTYDQAHGRTGQHLMVHGACSSAGCYSMTDEQVEEIYAFGRDSFRGGQREFQVQAFPFRMTPQNMARYRSDPNYPFWKMLKEGYDHFELTKVPPKVDVCEKRYVFNQTPAGRQSFSPTGACPPMSQPKSLEMAYFKYQQEYTKVFNAALKARRTEPAPTITSYQEAVLVADWSKRRARGERVSREPPSLAAVAVAQTQEEPAKTPVAATASAYTSDATSSSMRAALDAASGVPDDANQADPAAPITTGSIPRPMQNPREAQDTAAAAEPAPQPVEAQASAPAPALGQRIRNLFSR